MCRSLEIYQLWLRYVPNGHICFLSTSVGKIPDYPIWGRKQNFQNLRIACHSGCEGKCKLQYIREGEDLGTWENQEGVVRREKRGKEDSMQRGSTQRHERLWGPQLTSAFPNFPSIIGNLSASVSSICKFLAGKAHTSITSESPKSNRGPSPCSLKSREWWSICSW